MIDPRLNLLLLSNSRKPDEKFLGWAADMIASHFHSCNRILFIPYASVTYPWDDYTALVEATFSHFGLPVHSIHKEPVSASVLTNYDGIVVGGGNTFNLLYHLQELKLLPLIGSHAHKGIPYLGWSAGSNIACPTIQTTNDMPVRDLVSLAALKLVPFQLNVHYTNQTLAGHGGESRSDRLIEFATVYPTIPVIGLREGSAIKVRDGHIILKGEYAAELFSAGQHQGTLSPGDITAQVTTGIKVD